MSRKASNRRGAPVGNQYARKHGFYSKVRTPKECQLISSAARLNIDNDIAVLRVKIYSIVEKAADNDRLFAYAEKLLHKMILAKQQAANQNCKMCPYHPHEPAQQLNIKSKTDHARKRRP